MALRSTEPDWWRTAVVYQIYPRSFADSDADGIGDLPGIVSRLDYLADLGVDAIWMTPFYPSPLADGGYDVADYRDIDRRLGTLEDFDRLLAEAHERGIKILIDIVPNHTSDQHPWFQQALTAGPGSPERDRYLFRDGAGDGSEAPSDWQSHFGGSAWERLPDGQWYCHLFAREQPDLNWANPEVREYFLDTLRFWADRGVDGFRVDVAHALAKDMTEPLRSQRSLDLVLPVDGTDPLYDRDELHEIYRTWRQVFDEYDPPKMAVAETWSPTSSRNYLYARPDELGQVFDFALLKSAWGSAAYRATIETSMNDQRTHAGAGGGLTWVLSSHDVPRHASRLAVPDGVLPEEWLVRNNTDPVIDAAEGLRRARAATLMMLALPGSAYLYQGEELGLPEVADLPAQVLQDPVWERTGHTMKGRDGCRVPLPWTRSGSSYGFGDNGSWLPQPASWAELSVEAQQDEGSTLQLYRAALSLRRSLPGLRTPAFSWVAGPEGVLAFERSDGFRCTVNFTDRPVPIDDAVVLVRSDEGGPMLAPSAATWTRSGG